MLFILRYYVFLCFALLLDPLNVNILAHLISARNGQQSLFAWTKDYSKLHRERQEEVRGSMLKDEDSLHFSAQGFIGPSG